MNAFDIVLTVVGLIFAVRCLLKGFINELSGLASVGLGLLASLCLYKNGGVFVRQKFSFGVWVFPEVIAFAVIFAAVFIAVRIVGAMLNGIVERVELIKGLDKMLGAVLGLAEAFAMIMLVLFAVSIQPLFEPAALFDGSFYARFLLPIVIDSGNALGVNGV